MYIRFKEIPQNEISGVYDGDLGKIRDEIGTSCYNAIKVDNTYRILLPSLSEGCLYDLIGFIQDSLRNEIPIYLLSGHKVGLGSYGEPLIKNIVVLEELKIIDLHNPKPVFKMDRTNPQFVVVNNKTNIIKKKDKK
jgi:hypothetical protein